MVADAAVVVGRSMWNAAAELSEAHVSSWDGLWPGLRDAYVSRAAVSVRAIRAVQARPGCPVDRDGLVEVVAQALCEEFREFGPPPFGGWIGLGEPACDSYLRRAGRAVDALDDASLLTVVTAA